MARFLQKLGRAAYQHRKTTVAIWFVILLVAGSAAGVFMGKLSNSFSLPGTETERVLNLMAEELPELSGGSGTVVFTTETGGAFTSEQESAIKNAIAQLNALGFVAEAVNPFEMQQNLDDAAAQIESGKTEIAENERKLDDGEAELESGRKQLSEAKKQLEAAQAEIDANEPKLVEGREQLEAARPQLEAAALQLEQGRVELESGEAQYRQGVEQLVAGEEQLASGRTAFAEGEKTLREQRAMYNAGVAALTQGLGVSELSQVPAAIAQARAQIQAAIDAGMPPEAAKDELERLDEAQTRFDQLSAVGPQLTAGEQQLEQKRGELEAGATQLAASRTQLEAAYEQLVASRAEYEAGRAEYEAGRAEFDSNEAELIAGEQALAEGKEQLKQGQRQITENEKKLAEAEKQITEGREQLAAGEDELLLGERTAALASAVRFVSADGSAAISQIQFDGQVHALTDAQRADLMAIADDAQGAGVDMLYSQEILSNLNSVFGVAEAVGFVIAAIVLLFVLGTVVAAGLPLLVAIVGVAIGVCSTLSLSSLIDMQSITPVLALMLGLAVGIDYSLFIVHRHRTQLLAGMPLKESVPMAIGTSGNAVVFAGLTVVIALAALVVPGLPFLSVLGLSAAFTVFVAVLLSITLTPALLGFIGERVLTKKGRAARAEAIAASGSAVTTEAAVEASGKHNRASRWWSAVVTRHAWLAAIGVILFLGVMAVPAASMKTALPDGGSEPLGSDAERSFTVVSDAFGPGFNGPLLVMAQLPEGTEKSEADILLLDVAEEIAGTEGVVAAVPVTVNDTVTYGALQVIPAGGPSSPETEAVVHDIRNSAANIEAHTGVSISVTGQVAAQIDVSQKITDALAPYLLIVVGLSLLLLLLVFRSLVVPLLATGGFLLSLAASFGATVAIYQWGWLGTAFGVHNPGPVLSFLPILLTGILFGLAMDYQVFIVTAMREAYVSGGDARRAVRSGFNLAAPVVVAAALIMISVFSGFIFSHLAMIRPLGFGLAIGVLFDAFFVRMTFIPAAMQILGRYAWYLPKWLNRILPHVDVEGANLAASEAPRRPAEVSG